MRKTVRPNTPDEEAAIQRGIDADPDNPELGEDFFREARPAAEMLPPALYAELTGPKRMRGPGKKPAKVLVSLRVPPDVLDRLRASGPGWQQRAEQALSALAGAGEAER